MRAFLLGCSDAACLASFEVLAPTTDHGVTHCRFCGGELIDLSFVPLEQAPEGADGSTRVVTRSAPTNRGGDLAEAAPRAIGGYIRTAESRGVPVELRAGRSRGLLLSRRDFELLVRSVPFEVVARSHPHRWWSAELAALDVDAVGQGLDDALRTLAAAVRRRVHTVLEADDDERARYLLAALRAWLEDREGRLEAVLEEAAVFDDAHYCGETVEASA